MVYLPSAFYEFGNCYDAIGWISEKMLRRKMRKEPVAFQLY